ncbi:MAG: 4Fe-4S dicluster domain-containing protein, partial [Bacteroidales bacterium]|nr:4Fe-4S dicluster domain-containing protein [Bacteroidales bacterium]
AKPVSVIEDTAVVPERLPDYMADFGAMLKRLNLSCVYHAHIGTGELHLRPVLNLKEQKDRELFHTVAHETALLVKKHRGSLSGEHGDGRLRGEFIPLMYGKEIYNLFVELKRCWDPADRFNAGKIVNTPPMDSHLRFDKNQSYPGIKTYFNFDDDKGLFCSIEQCNGSGDCRRDKQFGGTLCPSYKAGKTEFFATRARANILRELLSRPQSKRIFDQPEIKEILDYCLACKACKSECPSNVDMTRLKSEILQHCYDVQGTPLRSFMVARMAMVQRLGSLVPDIYNFFAKNRFSSAILKKILKFASQREIPSLSRKTLRRLVRNMQSQNVDYPNGTVYLFADEFTNYMEAELGVTFVKLLNGLGYKVLIPKHKESGRAAISKGVVKLAKKFAQYNVENLCDIITDETPLVGIEPSCILSFRDEYPDLVEKEWKERAKALAHNALLFDEFIVREMEKGKITARQFDGKSRKIYLHGHCHQKALVGVGKSAEMLRLPVGNEVTVIPSGCCGMAGSFGYEKEHYDFSLQVGEQVLFPAVRKAVAENPEVIIAAPGTSCREQIKHGTGRTAYHPIEVMYSCLAAHQ